LFFFFHNHDVLCVIVFNTPLSDVPVEGRMLIGQQPPFINQWMWKVEFWLAYSQIITQCFFISDSSFVEFIETLVSTNTTDDFSLHYYKR